jgi:riboflavin-specific deaminase-like protein
VRQLLPDFIENADPVALYGADERPTPADRPWVLVNMIASVDGATALAQRSGGLGGPPDRQVFRALRELPDAILVGASTVRTEGYGPVRLEDEAVRRRRARGQSDTPRLVIISGSLKLDATSTLFTESAVAPIIVTTTSSDEHRRRELEVVAEVMIAGDGRVSIHTALHMMRAMGVRTLLCEGGPIVNAQLVAGDLIDEWCQTISPLLVGGTSSRAAVGDEGADPLPHLRLRRLLEQDDMLLANYVRSR